MIKSLPANVKIIKLDDLEHVANNYDMLFFHGSCLISDMVEMIEYMTRNDGSFSHVGMYATPHLFPEQKDKFVNSVNNGLVFESTANIDLKGKSDGVPDLITGKDKIGVQVRDVRKVITSYYSNGKNYVLLAFRLLGRS